MDLFIKTEIILNIKLKKLVPYGKNKKSDAK